MMKIDPYNYKKRYTKWKESIQGRIPEISKENSDLILSYLEDMEIGVNIGKGSSKGSRGYHRLDSLRGRMIFFSKRFKEIYGLSKITEIQEAQLFKFFSNMKNGTILRDNGKIFIGTGTYVSIFKAFWHWWQKINKKKGIEIPDITADLSTKGDKPKWVYLTEEQVKKLANSAKYEYKVLILFLFDTGMRAPTELINIRISDLYNDCKEVHIRDEISKTFGRRIKLMICSQLIKEYLEVKGLKNNDQLFNISGSVASRYLKRLAERVLGDKVSDAGKMYSQISLYDFRHCSCCYWLPRYKSESALKYRFGWKKSDKIHYYSELLGMKDTISEEDLLVDVTKTEIEQRLMKSEQRAELLQEDNQDMKKQMQTIMKLLLELRSQVQIVV